MSEIGLKNLARGKYEMFQHMKPLAHIPSLMSHKGEMEDQTITSPLFLAFKEQHPSAAKLLEDQCEHKEVGFSLERQQIQERKMDVPKLVPEGPIMDLAEEYTYRMYRLAFEAPLSFDLKHVATAAPGHPYPLFGITTKGDAVKSELHKKLVQTKPDPIWKSSPKGGEALPIADLKDGKLRTFLQVPTYFADYQKHYFDGQNQAMKKIFNRTWGKYGYVKQYKGFHRLMKLLEKHDTRYMGDVSGWDRSISLDPTYKLRTRGLSKNPLFKNDDTYQWVVRNTVTPLVCLSDGTVCRRQTGNNSGSNNTTTDNTVAHTIVMFYFLIFLYYKKHNSFPTYEQLMEYSEELLFGDDSAGSIDREFFGVEDKDQFYEDVSHVYSLFGLKVKKTAFLVQFANSGDPVQGIEFLGSTCHFENNMYIPYPRLSKLMFSITCQYSSDVETPEVAAAKATAITNLLNICGNYTAEASACAEYCGFLYSHFTQNMIALPESTYDSLAQCSKGQVDYALHFGYESHSTAS